MTRPRRFAPLALAALLVASLLGSGCAEELGDIDRTQANRLRKADLLGAEWYFGQTVTKTPFTTSYTFQLDGGDLERIRFVVEESYLLAYRSYEFVPGADDHQDPEDYRGELMAAYKILSHFDVQREYNPTTGEETNVIVENTTDRQWWEREYMRVDWSVNMAPSIDPAYEWFTWHVFNISHVAPVSYFVQDTPAAEADMDRAEFDVSDGRMSFVNRYALHFNLDECLNSVFGQLNCGPSEVNVRNVFMRIDEPSTYEPREYRDNLPLTWDDGTPLSTDFSSTRGGVVGCDHGTHPYDNQDYCSQDYLPIMDRFGYFRTGSIFGGRPEWDDRRGTTWESRHERIMRHNIWKTSRDEDGNLIPMDEREPKPIDFIMSWDYPEHLKPTVRESVEEWDRVFKRLLQELRHPEGDNDDFRMVTVRDNNCSPAGLKAFLAANPAMQEVLDRVLADDAVTEIDGLTLQDRAKVCAALDYNTRGRTGLQRFTWAKQGDLGINLLNFVGDPMLAGPLGIATIWMDPVTGEVIHQAATVFGASLDTYISFAADVVDVLNGKLDLNDLIYGVNVREELAGRTRDTPNQKSGDGAEARQENLLRAHLERMQGRMGEMVRTPTSPAVLHEINGRFRALGNTPEQVLGAGMPRTRDAMLQKMRGSPLERSMITEEMIKMFNPSWVPGQQVTEEMYERASPLSWAFGRGRGEWIERVRRAERHNVLLGDFMEEQIIGLALQMADLSREELYQRLYHQVFKGVLLHEIGHGVGLRHNFMGSHDALNYHEDYWRIWEETREQADTEGWSEDRLLEERSKRRMGEFQYTSIMDYGSRFNSDIQGLGKWDEAAILFGYGNLIEVWGDEVTLDLDSNPLENAEQDYWSLSSAIFLRTSEFIPELVGGDIDHIQARRTMDFDEYAEGYRKALMASASAGPEGERDNPGPIVKDRAVPYGFCEDLYAGPPGGYPACQRWDFGATQVEKTRDTINYYRNYYFFNNFRRERFDDYGFYNGFVYRLTDRVFDRLITTFKYFFFYHAIIGQALIDPTDAQGIEFGRDFARAAMEGINLLGEVLQTPDYGRFCLGNAETQRYAECDAGEFCPWDYFEDCEALGLDQAEIPFGVGRIPFFQFSNDLMFKYDVMGSVFEKLLAIMALTDTMSVFYGMDFTSNFGTFEINPYRLFHHEMLELFAGLITGENEHFSGVFMGGDPDTGDFSDALYKPRMLVDPGKRYPEGFLMEENLEGGVLVDGMTNFTVSFYASMFGMAMMSSPYDGTKNFSDYTRVVLAGSGDDYLDGIPAEALEGGDRICELTDPDTLFTYRAVQTPDGRSIACLLMARAQEILDGVEVDGEIQGSWFDAKDAFERAKAAWERDPGDNSVYERYVDARAEFERIDIRLDHWIDRITMLRDIQATFEPGH